MASRSALLGGLLVAFLTGCNQKSDDVDGSGPPLGSSRDFEPAASPPTRASLTLAGVSIPVQVKTTVSGKQLDIVSLQDSRPVDREVYITEVDGFHLVHAAGEDFDPPLPLLKFPMRIGAKWAWQGMTTADGAPQSARATVKTGIGRIPVAGHLENAVEVNVDLEMGTDTANPMPRQLQLWFVKGHGVVKRAFGEESVRESTP